MCVLKISKWLTTAERLKTEQANQSVPVQEGELLQARVRMKEGVEEVDDENSSFYKQCILS